MTSVSFHQAPIETVANGLLFRAHVSLPPEVAYSDEGAPPERIVFFEAPNDNEAAAYLEDLLAKVWCIDTTGWLEGMHILYMCSIQELRAMSATTGVENDLQLFELGTGGPDIEIVRDSQISYARANQVDLYVSPRVALRLRDALDTIEAMYLANASSQSG
jgi:hypothetical protein